MGQIVTPISRVGSVRRQPLASLSISGWPIYTGGFAAAVAKTMVATVPVEGDCVAVRAIFANPSAAPFTLGGVVVRASDTYPAGAPTGAGTWQYLTFANGGADVDVPRDPATTLPQAVTIPANAVDPATGDANVPALYFSDWNFVSTLPRADANAVRVLVFRALLPAQTIPGILMTAGWAGVPAVNQGRDYSVRIADGDAVTTPANSLSYTTAPMSIFYGFQFLMRNRTITVAIQGDSIHQGYTSSANCNNFITQACMAISALGGVPVVPFNAAFAGSPSARFGPIANAVIAAAKPPIIVLPSYTPNDSGNNTALTRDRVLARVFQSAQKALAQGAVPIITTPWPRDSATMSSNTVLTGWQGVRAALLADKAVTGAYVFDGAALVGDVSTGLWAPAYTNDNIHINDAGHVALKGPFQALLQQIISR